MRYTTKEHFLEIRRRFLACVLFYVIILILVYQFANLIYDFLVQPYYELVKDKHQRLIYISLTEGFFTKIKISLSFTNLLSMPFCLYHIYMFITPALHRKEKRVVLPLFFLAPILFILGLGTAYYIIFPRAWSFFLSFEMNSSLPTQFELTVSNYVSVSLQIMLAFGLAYQLPLIMILLCKIGFISVRVMQEKRKHIIVLIFIVAAILTPPDVISQIGLAIPMLLLYELSIIICKKL